MRGINTESSDSSNQHRSYERISPTAWYVACTRTLSDIPFSQEIFLELQDIIKRTRSSNEVEEFENNINLSKTTPMFSVYAPYLEARFKIVSHLLKAHGISQILEIAAGFSGRGLEMARDSSVEYVEFDLPNVIHEKKGIVEKLIAKSTISNLSNLHFEYGNALNPQDLLKATRFFKEEPIAIVNEGLLGYLDSHEKTVFGRNIRWLLKHFGGIWITPDISKKMSDAKWISDEELREIKYMIEELKQMTGVDISNNYFEDEEEAKTFFENLGFSVEQHSSIEVIDELVSPQKWNLNPEKVEKIARYMTVFAMEANPRQSSKAS